MAVGAAVLGGQSLAVTERLVGGWGAAGSSWGGTNRHPEGRVTPRPLERQWLKAPWRRGHQEGSQPAGLHWKGEGPQRQPQRRLDRRLAKVAKAVGGGYCRLQMPLKVALGSQRDSGWAQAGRPGRGGGGNPHPLPVHPCQPGLC